VNGGVREHEMKGWQRFLVLVAALCTVNLATWIVVTANQGAGLYPADADSIGIPLLGTLFASALVILPLAAIAFIPQNTRVGVLCARGKPQVVAVYSLLGLMYLLVGLFALLGFTYWAMTHHYAIGSSYAALLVVLSGFLVGDVRRVLSNRALQGTQASGGAARLRP
jgi:hypothetical protein